MLLGGLTDPGNKRQRAGMWFSCFGLYKAELQCTACVSGVDVKYSLFY